MHYQLVKKMIDLKEHNAKGTKGPLVIGHSLFALIIQRYG